MKFLVLFLAIFAIANGYVKPLAPKARIHPLIPKLPRMPTLPGAPTDVSPRIVGGGEAVPHSRPFQVALYIDDLYFCGGSLISTTWVLTAGHCTVDTLVFIMTILGAHEQSNSNEAGQVRITSRKGDGDITTHADYSALTLHNDVGLIRLPTAVGLTANIQPVTLPSPSDADLAAGVQVVISGWGATSDTGSVNSVLKDAIVPTITNSLCEQTYGSVTIQAYTLCTSSASGDGTCFGDSGGPLTYDNGNGVAVHRGVTSFVSSAGCQSGNPDGFSRTKYFRDWITQISGV